jgi:hypothetical protein
MDEVLEAIAVTVVTADEDEVVVETVAAAEKLPLMDFGARNVSPGTTPRAPPAVTTASPTRRPAASPTPNRLPSMVMHPPAVGR